MYLNRFDIYRVNLEPAKGHEMNKQRPCVIISPDAIHNHMAQVIVAPLTTKGYALPFRVPCRFADKEGLILLDHLRSIDKMRLGKHLGTLEVDVQQEICHALHDLFAF